MSPVSFWTSDCRNTFVAKDAFLLHLVQCHFLGDKIIPNLINFSLSLFCHPLIIEEPQPVGAFESCSKKKTPNI